MSAHYLDRTFCSSDCINSECHRNFSKEHQIKANEWWGSQEGEPLVAFSDFSYGCASYRGPEEGKFYG